MHVVNHSPAFFEFTKRKKIYIRDIYSIVLLNVVKMNINVLNLLIILI